MAADAREVDLHSQMAAAMRNSQDEKLRILHLIGPLQSGFDPAKDYGGDLARAVEPKRGTSAQAPRTSSPGRSNKTLGRKDGDGGGVIGAMGRAFRAGDRAAAVNRGPAAKTSPKSEGAMGSGTLVTAVRIPRREPTRSAPAARTRSACAFGSGCHHKGETGAWVATGTWQGGKDDLGPRADDPHPKGRISWAGTHPACWTDCPAGAVPRPASPFLTCAQVRNSAQTAALGPSPRVSIASR